MKTRILVVLFIPCFALGQHAKWKPPSGSEHPRVKRDAVGALHIVTNHAQPIHADVKADNEATEKPCPENSRPSHIESGVGFQVTPPEAGKFELKSLRKSGPLHPDPSILQLNDTKPTTSIQFIRTTTRAVTLIVLFIAAVCEFYSVFAGLMTTIYRLMHNQ